MTTIYQKTKGLQDTTLHYCPGCRHGIVHQLIGEVMEEMGIIDTTIGICPVGCAVFAGNYFAGDTIEAAHGRAPAVATAVKRTHPDQPVFTYQGDGDLASIGAAEIIHADLPLPVPDFLCKGYCGPAFKHCRNALQLDSDR